MFKGEQSSCTATDKAASKRCASKGADTDAIESQFKKPRPVEMAATAAKGANGSAAVSSNLVTDMSIGVDSDDDIEPVVPKSLHWRSHPELSDWSIEVWTVPDKSDVIVERYPVHKSVLALESLFFAKLFTEEQHQTTRTSRFDLSSEAAVVFPKLLDYLYAPSSLIFTTENAAIFYYFGQMLGLPRLRWEAKQFWTADLNLSTVGSYYQQAVVLDIGRLLAAVTNACASKDILLHLTIDSPLLQVPRVEALLDLVQTVGPMHSEHLSVLVAKFCSLHFPLGVIDKNAFHQLTNPDKMPEIDPSVVFTLLDLEYKILAPGKHEDNNGEELSSLQERCLTTLEQCWDTIDFACEQGEECQNTSRSLHTDNKVMSLLRNQSPAFLLALWQRTLSAAQTSRSPFEQCTLSAAQTSRSPFRQSSLSAAQNSRSQFLAERAKVTVANRTAAEYLPSDTDDIQGSEPEPCDDVSESVGADLVTPTVW
jgi:BTB/POZ domain